ncbi:MAG: DNA-binding protein [Roseateles asaccharophilus]|uniref:DNA-binding protein n=1 Tax=Roseateles asaccharophilus TaxID=582607 RepID=UPI00391BCB57
MRQCAHKKFKFNKNNDLLGFLRIFQESRPTLLKARFSDTKALYREVCALMFFRYGITPTASKLYQHVRKGSMSAPADALTKFWDELRSKARVQIDHPDLPEALKLATADAVQTLWSQATELARTELAALRVEAQAESTKALTELEVEQQRSHALETQMQDLQGQLIDLTGLQHSRNETLEGERRAHAATGARADVLQCQVDELRALQDRIRADFGVELEKGRFAIEAANERAAGAERRSL